MDTDDSSRSSSIPEESELYLTDESSTRDVSVSITAFMEQDREIAALQAVVKKYRKRSKVLKEQVDDQRQTFYEALISFAAEKEKQRANLPPSELKDANQILIEHLKKASIRRDEALEEVERLDNDKAQLDFQIFKLNSERSKLEEEVKRLRKERDDAKSKLSDVRKQRNQLTKTVTKVSKERDESLQIIRELEQQIGENPAHDSGDNTT